MSRKRCKEISEDGMTEVERRIDSLIREDMGLTKEIDRIERRMNAEVAVLRQEIREKTGDYESQIETLKSRKQNIRDEILDYWEKTHGDVVTVIFPSAMVSKRDYRELVIHDKEALLDALDAIDRLDLVDYVFKENEVARLQAEGELKAPDSAVSVIDHFNFQFQPAPGKE